MYQRELTKHHIPYMNRLRIVTFLLLMASYAQAFCQDTKVNYIPQVHGALRARFEADTQRGGHRFQVRNARVSLAGQMARNIDYFLQSDFCDQGKFKFLDAWIRFGITRGLSVQAGQFRMPFGVDCFRAPNNYIFANRSFIGKQICNVRAVGVKAGYTFPKVPLTVEGGLFNPTPIGDHMVWNDNFAYSFKATLGINNVKLATGFQSIIPDEVRANLIDGSVSWQWGRWLVEGEYMYKHYADNMHKACHGYLVYVDYAMPIGLGVFNKLSFQGRFDGMTDHSTAKRNAAGLLMTDDPARNRITAGATISYVRAKTMLVDLRVNYEKYFYHAGMQLAKGNGDKIVLEAMLRF